MKCHINGLWNGHFERPDFEPMILLLHCTRQIFSGLLATAQRESITVGVFHLPRNSGNSGWNVNGTHVFGSYHWKISGINGTSEKVVLFSRWKLSDGNVCSIYNF